MSQSDVDGVYMRIRKRLRNFLIKSDEYLKYFDLINEDS